LANDTRFNAVRDWAACTTATIVWPKDVQFGSSFEAEPRPRRDDINSVRRSLLTLSGPSIHGPVINQGFFRRFQRKEAALHFGEAQPTLLCEWPCTNPYNIGDDECFRDSGYKLDASGNAPPAVRERLGDDEEAENVQCEEQQQS